MLYLEFFDVPQQVKMGKWSCPFFLDESVSPHMLSANEKDGADEFDEEVM